MSGLRQKILLPLMLLSMLLIGYLYGSWMPHSLEHIREQHQNSTSRQLDSIAESLIPLLLGHQLDTVYENLDALHNQERDWISIELSDAHGKSIYPLVPPSPQPASTDNREIHVLQKQIEYLGINLGYLTIQVDFSPNLSQMEEQHRKLVAVLVGAILAFLLSSWFVLERLVIRPVKSLNQATEALAEKRFEGELVRSGNDEVGELVDGFVKMRDAIHEYQHALVQRSEELESYKNSLEETVRQRTNELRLALDAAQTANKAKSIFLANMSHELRTPLNAILGFSNVMRKDPMISSGQRENLDIINRSGEYLLKLINDVLDMAKIEAGRLQLEIAPFDLGIMVRDVTDMMGERAQSKGLRLLLDQASEFPRYIKGDEARLRQILVNLVGNAIKFTDQGGITIRLGTRQNGGEHLLIDVEDTGCGISAEDQKRLFVPFVQLAEGIAQHGTGLGLAITRQFVQLMRGTITIDSEPGKGSIFHIDVPIEAATSADVHKPDENIFGEVTGLAPGQPHYRILIVEDQKENQLLLSHLMNDIGVETEVAENGAQAIEKFQQWHPDLIWMDRRMPVMDGTESTQQIRKLPGGDRVKIIAVTASAFKEQQQEMLDAGMDDFVRKPYRFDEIYQALARQLGVQYLYRQSDTRTSVPISLTPEMLIALSPPPSGEIEKCAGIIGQRKYLERHSASERNQSELRQRVKPTGRQF